MECLLLRFDAPMMSFGGTCVDQINPTDSFPGRAMITGLIGNALGWDHRDMRRLDALQGRLRVAARWDAEPERIIDYHTVDLGQEHLKGTGWTTRGRPEERGGGNAARGTHIRFRHYWANGVVTAAVTVVGEEEPSLSEIEAALRRPARPLFLGRKTCIPAVPILLERRVAGSLREALLALPLAEIRPRSRPSAIFARWPAEEGDQGLPGALLLSVYDRRDWRGNVPRGVHHYFEGLLEVSP